MQVRDSDPSDPHRTKTVQLLDDFLQPSVNGNRILPVKMPLKLIEYRRIA